MLTAQSVTSVLACVLAELNTLCTVLLRVYFRTFSPIFYWNLFIFDRHRANNKLACFLRHSIVLTECKCGLMWHVYRMLRSLITGRTNAMLGTSSIEYQQVHCSLSEVRSTRPHLSLPSDKHRLRLRHTGHSYTQTHNYYYTTTTTTTTTNISTSLLQGQLSLASLWGR